MKVFLVNNQTFFCMALPFSCNTSPTSLVFSPTVFWMFVPMSLTFFAVVSYAFLPACLVFYQPWAKFYLASCSLDPS